MFWILKNIIQGLNFANDNYSYWLRRLIYLSMIDEHIISIEFGSNSFNVIFDFKGDFKRRSIYELKCLKWMI
jgi:hypothetical protein